MEIQYTIQPGVLTDDYGKVFSADDIVWTAEQQKFRKEWSYNGQSWVYEPSHSTTDWAPDGGTNGADLDPWDNGYLYVNDDPQVYNFGGSGCLLKMLLRDWIKVSIGASGPAVCSDMFSWHIFRGIWNIGSGWEVVATYGNEVAPGEDWGSLPQ